MIEIGKAKANKRQNDISRVETILEDIQAEGKSEEILDECLAFNENVLKNRSGCTKAAIVYKDVDELYLKVMDLDVDKNKVKLEDSNFINGFVKAEPIKDDAYISELFYRETEKYF